MKRLVLVALTVVALAVQILADDGARRGVELLRAGNYEAALVALRDAQIENPESPWLHFNIGLALYKLERWDEAAKSFSSALYARDADVEKRAELHLGNCAFQQGKLKEALDHYNRALVIDEDFEDAKVNREFVTRKLKELARKKKDQEKQQEKQRKIIEKLQELIKEQVGVHAGTRRAMAAGGMSVAPTPIEDFASALDFELPDDTLVEPRSAEDDEKLLVAIGEGQEMLVSKLRELLVEVREKIAAAKEQAPAQPGAPPAAGAAPVDPAEIAKLEKAVPFLAAAEPPMTHARDGALEGLNWTAVHSGQQEAVEQLLKALRELLDELTRIIQDQVQLMKETAGTAASTMNPDEDRRLAGDALKDRCEQHRGVEEKLRERTTRFATGVEQQLDSMRQQATPDPTSPNPQPTTHPGEVPEEQLVRIEKAISHLARASVEMEEAEARLEVPEPQPALESEKRALEELIKARAMLSPPQEQQDENQEGDDGEQDKEQEGKDGEKGEQQDKKEGEDSSNSDPGEKGEDEKQPEEEKKKDAKMSEEQARKMLEQARQGERDRRREERDEARRARGTGRGGVKKDW